MTAIYRCDFCGKEFTNSLKCELHEAEHLTNVEQVKDNLLHLQDEYICDYCDNSYYVYGYMGDCAHKDCDYKNNYKDFIPVEPLHNKHANGGILC